MAKRKRGRPTELTPETQDKFCAAIKRGLGYEQAATVAGISHQTYRNWVNRAEAELERVEANSRASIKKAEAPYVDFLEAVQRAKADGELFNADVIDQAAQGGYTWTETKEEKVFDPITRTFIVTEKVTTTKTAQPDWRAAAFVLERRHPDRWTKTVKNQVSGPDGGPIQTEDVGLTDEERAKRIAEILDRARASGN